MRINARRVDDRTVRSDGGNLAAYLYGLRGSTEHDDRAAWDLLMHRLRHTAPFIRDLVPEPVGRDHVRLDWIDSRGDRYGVHQLSDGTLRALALFAALGQPIARRPRFITIDEPELGLHPSALHSVCELIRSVAPTTQVLMATQSPGLLDQFEPADVIVVEAHEEGSVFRRLDPLALSGWLDEYTLSDLFEKNVLGGRP
ncbi:MAG: AAA family ATPase [Myxococcota bacterium]